MPEAPHGADPRALLRVLWRWKLVFLLVLVAAPVVAYFIENGKPRLYQSSVLLSVQTSTVDTSVLGGSSSFPTSNIDAVARIVTTSPVARLAAAQLHEPSGAAAALSGEVSASSDPTTNFLTISATDRTPTRAAAVASAFAAAIRADLTANAVSEVNSAIAGVHSQLNALPAGPTSAGQRVQLRSQLQQLKNLRSAQGNLVQVLQPAVPSSAPVSPHVRRAVELGLVIGLLLAIGAVALIENSDLRIRNPSDLEELTRLPLLSAIPAQAFSVSGSAQPERSAEAFQMLRASLTYFNVDRRLATIVVTSPGTAEGKTTVAIGLAVAAASAGNTTILIDADLRRGGVAERLELTASAGLSEVLAGTAALNQVLVDYPVDTARGGRLLVLPAGPPPPNPGQLLSSQELQRLLTELSAYHVIVDTPAALVVSDLLPLLPSASGVLLIARMNRSGRESVRRLQRMIAAASGTALGVVATGVRGGLGAESYRYEYSGSHGGFWRRLGRNRRNVPRGVGAAEEIPLAPPRARDA